MLRSKEWQFFLVCLTTLEVKILRKIEVGLHIELLRSHGFWELQFVCCIDGKYLYNKLYRQVISTSHKSKCSETSVKIRESCFKTCMYVPEWLSLSHYILQHCCHKSRYSSLSVQQATVKQYDPEFRISPKKQHVWVQSEYLF